MRQWSQTLRHAKLGPKRLDRIPQYQRSNELAVTAISYIAGRPHASLILAYDKVGCIV